MDLLTRSRGMTEQAVELIQRAMKQWRGCAWATSFGRGGLNLDGITASQARLVAWATTGQEALDWREAASWLDQVEADARQAAAHGGRALGLVRQGRPEAALEELGRACQLEERYPGQSAWQSARGAVAAELGLTC